MIIQCRQCRTKFRFDDEQMQGDGIWLRCGRCQHVFFQDNLQRNGKQRPAVNALSITPAPPETAGLPVDTGHDEDVERFLDSVMEPEKTEAEAIQVPVKTGGKISFTDIDLSADEPEEELPEEELASDLPPRRKKSGLFWKAALWSVLVIILIPAVLLFVVFPEKGQLYIQLGRQLIGTPVPVTAQAVTGYVKLQDIRQRIVNNYVLGNLRIIEGTAVNQADFPISRVLIKGEIVDAYAVVLGERQSYAGNILTDDDLMNLSEEGMLTRLSRPEGLNNANEQIAPGGQIPFMIVFTREPPGSIKTTVTTIGAERLLQ
ncbi:MAG: DUF3426 domain-containing protein [Smithellaceae bacterium]